MNLAELQQEVYTISNRSDLVAQTLTAIRSATLKCHQLDYFPKDVFETGVDFLAEEYYHQLEYNLLLPRWRALKYLKKTDVNGSDSLPFFQIIDIPIQARDPYGVSYSDVCYLAGDVINIKSSTQFRYAILGCYRHPDVTPASYSSWIAEEHPYAIVYEAASTLFKLTGDTEQFAAYTRLAQEEQQLIRISQIQSVGY
jgi:hypothetical protein